jgi:hypothetical protein
MARFGQIPPYGKRGFRLSHDVPTDYTLDISHRAYVLKVDDRWSIRSTRDSHHWTVYLYGQAVGQPMRTLTLAMDAVLAAYADLNPAR